MRISRSKSGLEVVRPVDAEHPPRLCPECAADVSRIPCNTVQIHRFGRALQKAAIAILPVMLFVFIYNLGWGRLPLPPGTGPGAGWVWAGYIGGPSAFLGVLSLFMPRVRVMHCYRCGWHKEYRFKERFVG